MVSALQRLCDSLVAAVRPVDAMAAELTSRARGLRAAGNRIGALGRTSQDLDLRSAAVQLLAAAAALERSAAMTSRATQQAHLYVNAMLATGQVTPPRDPVAAGDLPAGAVSPEYSRRLRRDAWVALGTAFGREAAWEAGPLIVGEFLRIQLPESAVIRQAAGDIPVAVAALSQFFHRLGK